MIGIYCIRNRVNGKVYTGQTRNLAKRKSAHKLGDSNCLALQSAIGKYGWHNFSWEVLELCLEENLNVRECHWIATLDCMSPNGYNIKQGGDSGRHSEETRQKLSEIQSSKQTWLGRKHTQVSKRKMAEARTGTKHTAESRKKMSESAQGRAPWNKGKRGVQIAWNKGKKCPQISKGLKKRNQNPLQLQLFD